MDWVYAFHLTKELGFWLLWKTSFSSATETIAQTSLGALGPPLQPFTVNKWLYWICPSSSSNYIECFAARRYAPLRGSTSVDATSGNVHGADVAWVSSVFFLQTTSFAWQSTHILVMETYWKTWSSATPSCQGAVQNSIHSPTAALDSSFRHNLKNIWSHLTQMLFKGTLSLNTSQLETLKQKGAFLIK